jgi:prepilin-type N-terminal cleavage/methylation domain-containing protein
MELRLTNHNQRGFTLAEMLVAVAIGFVVIAGAVSFYSFAVASFAAMSNFTDMNQKERYATDIISRDIRSSTAVSSATSSQLVLTGNDAVNIIYNYDVANGTLTRVRSNTSQVLLTGIVNNSLSWTMYQRAAPGANYDVFPVAATPAAAKLISMHWNCWRQVSGTETNSHAITMAKIELRNQ